MYNFAFEYCTEPMIEDYIVDVVKGLQAREY